MAPGVQRTTQKQERLEARVSPAMKALFQEAAALEGRSLTDFVVNSAAEAARRTIREKELLDLSQRDREVFVEALLHPPTPNTHLQRAAQHYEQVYG
jgi:uncharacterized protein (DUF1778 family)